MKQHTSPKTRTIEFILPLLFLVITACIYIPSTLYLGNIDEFKIDYIQIFPVILATGIAVFLAGVLIACLVRRNRRASCIFIDVVFGLTLGMYVQCNFLNSSLKQLNGAAVEWNNASMPAILSIVAWGICLVIPHLVRLIAEKIESKITTYGSALLSVMQMVSLVVLLITTHRTLSTDVALIKKDEFLLSSKENVVVFVVDTLDAQWAEQYILSEPELKSQLKDFTYFDNVVSCGAPTILGMRVMLSGNDYDLTVPVNEYLRHAYDGSTLFSDMKNNGYGVRLYTGESLLEGADFENIENAVTSQEYKLASPGRFAGDMVKLTAYNVAPYPVKKYIHIYSGDLTSNAKIKDKDNENYILDDAVFYQDYLEDGISTTDQENCFVLYHLFGAHGPCTLDENALRVGENETSLKQQIHGVCKMIFEYIDEMKQLGLYNNSTIIITADHGGVDLYQNPAVFIKRKNQTGYAVNSAPVTFKNLRASFVEGILDNREAYGPSMFEVAEDADVGYRPHTFDSILYTNVFRDAEPIKGLYLQFQIGNPARNNDLILKTGLINDYKLGTTVKMCGPDCRVAFVTYGFSGIEENNRWTDGNSAVVPLSIVGDYKDLCFSMDYAVFNGKQHVIISANDHTVYDGILDGNTLDSVIIPGDYVDGGQLELKFELPDAISPKELGVSQDDRELALSLRSFVISATE